ncbi:MAG: hypothetical protein EBT78_14615 [Betaproteobacteria bacterium]|nr:hypothetical protein [Betaproteobacteria bacterium]NBT68982.1 hypothetical protein [Betaproteobacteria bacterium]
MVEPSKWLSALLIKFVGISSIIKRTGVINRNYFLAIGAFLHSLLILWPIIGSAFSADDTFDSMVPMQLRFTGQSTWSFISQYTSNWAKNEGRFFPGAATIGVFSHYLFTARNEYKIVQLIVALLAIFFFGFFVSKLFRSFSGGIVAVLIVNTCMQMHVQYDALFQFSLQQPSVVILLFGSLSFYLFGIRTSSNAKFFIAATMYLAVLLTYETTLLLWPLFPLILLIEKPKKYRFALSSTLLFPTVVAINLLWLRSNVTNNTAGYVSNFSGGVLTSTFLKQAVGSVPMSYSEIQPPGFLESFPHHIHLSSIPWLTAVALSILVLSYAINLFTTLDHRKNVLIILIGIAMWATPALVIAQTVRWQQELTWGNSYITVFQSSFGFALVLIGLISEAKLLLLYSNRIIRIGLCAIFVSVIALSTSSVMTNNSRAVAQFNPSFLWPRNSFENSISNGVFGNVPTGSKVLALNGEWWFNAPFVSWFGGPKLSSLDSPMNTAEWADCISRSETCLNRRGYSYVMNTYGRFPNEPRVVLVGRAEKMTGTDGDIKGIRLNSPRIFIDYPTKSNSLIESESRCLGWGKDRVGNVNGAVDDADVTVLKFDKSSCLLGFSEKVAFNPYQFTTS